MEIKEEVTNPELEIKEVEVITRVEEAMIPSEDEPGKPLSPIGITKKSHEESKKRKRMAKASRRINRRK